MNDTAQRPALRTVAPQTPAQKELTSAVHQLRARSSHSDSALAALRAQEESLMRKEAEIEQRAQELLAEMRDCQRAMLAVRDSIARLTR
jgi:Family of unknown function (DUF662).